VRLAVALLPAAQSSAILWLAIVCSAGAVVVASRLNRGYIGTLGISLVNRGAGRPVRGRRIEPDLDAQHAEPLPITRRAWRWHLVAFAGVLVATLVSGALLARPPVQHPLEHRRRRVEMHDTLRQNQMRRTRQIRCWRGMRWRTTRRLRCGRWRRSGWVSSSTP
jgi:hypothetical protein